MAMRLLATMPVVVAVAAVSGLAVAADPIAGTQHQQCQPGRQCRGIDPRHISPQPGNTSPMPCLAHGSHVRRARQRAIAVVAEPGGHPSGAGHHPPWQVLGAPGQGRYP